MSFPDARVDLRPGEVLAGKYRVERVLGAGGMGVVVAAHHIQLDEKVALKFLLPEAALDGVAAARFLQEARAPPAKVKSEHVARVIDVGKLESGSPFMVMEYLDGSDLAAWIEKHGAMPVEQAVDFVLQACEALADAHALGIVHRDLKPANLFCIQRSDGQLSIKVLDFGISKVTKPGAVGHDMTRTSALMGSPLYMSPEQMKLSKGVDFRTDIWSLGNHPLPSLSADAPRSPRPRSPSWPSRSPRSRSPSLRELRHDLPRGLQPVIERCLEKDRANRFQTVGELAIALREFGSKNARISVERVLGTLRAAGLSGDVLAPSVSFQDMASAPTLVDPMPPQTAATWGADRGGEQVQRKRPWRGSPSRSWSRSASLRACGSPQRRGPAASIPSASVASPPSRGGAPIGPDHPFCRARFFPSPPPPPRPRPPRSRRRQLPRNPLRKPLRHARIPPALRTAPVPPAASTNAAKPNCNPPYVIDSAGDRLSTSPSASDLTRASSTLKTGLPPLSPLIDRARDDGRARRRKSGVPRRHVEGAEV